MKILHITPNYYPFNGGAETFTKEVSERLAGRSHDVTVLTLRGTPAGAAAAAPRVEMVKGVQVKRFTAAGRFNDVLRLCAGRGVGRRIATAAVDASAIDLWDSSPYGFKPFAASVRSTADIVGVINWYDGWLPYQGRLARRVRKFSLIGIPLFHTECDWARRDIWADMLGGCDAVMTMTQHEREFVHERAPGTSACAVGVGVNPEEFKADDGDRIRRQYGLGDAPIVGYVGRMVTSKGVATLITAMRGVWRDRPEVRLLLAGSGLPTAAKPDDPIGLALAELDDVERARIVVIGEFGGSDKSAIFHALDVFAMPSVAESFGIAYLEAWMCGKPVIGSRIASTACVIEDGVDGLLVTPGHPEELAASIRCLLANDERRRGMGQRGRAKTFADFTWDRVTDRVEGVYNRTLIDRSA